LVVFSRSLYNIQIPPSNEFYGGESRLLEKGRGGEGRRERKEKKRKKREKPLIMKASMIIQA
jgi:hypothetical protein